MATRAAAKREAALLQAGGNQAALSSPPAAPASQSAMRFAKGGRIRNQSNHAAPVTPIGSVSVPPSALPTPITGSTSTKKRATVRSKKNSLQDEKDVLPHGLGRASDWSFNEAEVKVEDQQINLDHVETKEIVNSRARMPKQTVPAPPESSDVMVEGDSVSTKLLKPRATKKSGTKGGIVKRDDDSLDEYEESNKKRKRAITNSTIINTSNKIPKGREHGKAILPAPTKKQRTKKANNYGLTPGETPFPDFAMPTQDACEEVNRLLTQLHGDYKPPAVIPPPSITVAGCGEVPDLLEAILRTLLSASTTANNANMAFEGLVKKFGRSISSTHTKSLNWEAVRQADLETVIDAIKRGGLAKVKGNNIKKILDTVYEQNCRRRDALLDEKETGKAADVVGAHHETEDAKRMEISRSDTDLLCLDHMFELTTEEAMEEMTRLPGIGVKTASCVILFCMKRPSFAVDTHVWRHCKWLGWVPPTATRDQTFSHCEVRVPDHLKYSLHQLFLQHGKKCPRCRANTSAGTEEWESAICPIERLVNRNEKRKQLGPTTANDAKAKIQAHKKGRKMTKIAKEEVTEESDFDVDDSENE